MKTATLLKAQRRPRTSCGIRSKVTTPAGLRIKNVLAPIDFSERSVETLRLAAEIAKQFGANLHLAHVFEPDIAYTTVMAIPLALPPVDVAQGVRRHLKDVAKKIGAESLPTFIHAVKGKPFEEICGLARQLKIDLIVVPTRGNTGLKHLLLGSTAERIVRYSPCPVLVVHPRLHDENRALRFDRILVPVDFSDCALKGLEYAKRLAKQFGAKLTVLNSVAFQYYITSDEYALYDLPLLMEQAEKTSRREMRKLMETTDWDGIEVKPSLEIGHAGQQICARADEQKADLIVTSTHGTTGFKHILVGSTAEYVVRYAPCPVLVVPSHERPALGLKNET